MRRIRHVIFPLVLFGTVFALWICYQLWIEYRYQAMEVRGQHGDMFGGLNTLFSGLAFAGLIYTVLLQREELSLQRRELELTREELHRTAKANEEAAKALAKQIDTQLLAARISGMSALLTSCNERLADISRMNEGFRSKNQMTSVDNPELKTHREKLETELEQLLNETKKNAA